MRIRLSALVILYMSFSLCSFLSTAQLPVVTLTDSAKVSLLTCSQGDELYSIFGHSAIRVKDSSIGVDWVFNYGTFDFSDPNFYPNFVKTPAIVERKNLHLNLRVLFLLLSE